MAATTHSVPRPLPSLPRPLLSLPRPLPPPQQTVRQYRELLDHCSEGLRFYLGMSEVVRKAKQEAADFAFTRQVGSWISLEAQEEGGRGRSSWWPRAANPT